MEGEIRAEDIRILGGAPQSFGSIEVLVLPTICLSFLIRHEESIPKPSKLIMQDGQFVMLWETQYCSVAAT